MTLARPGAARYDAGVAQVITRGVHHPQERDVIMHGTYQIWQAAPARLTWCRCTGVHP